MDFNELGLTPEQIDVINKAIQSEGDKVRTKYSKELGELREELTKYKPSKKSDAEKLLEQRQKELEQKELDIANKEKSYMVKEKLTSKGLPSELAKYLTIGDDIDTTIEEFGGTLNSYFLNNTFKPKNHPKNEGITKKQFSKMSYAERTQLFETQPELYKLLSN